MRDNPDQDARYLDAAATFGASMQRLARASEANPERRRDLLQDMHVALWRSLATFDGRCSMRTWVYRVAHNVAASYIGRERRGRAGAVSVAEIEHLPETRSLSADIEQSDAIEKLNALIRKLAAPDRQVLTLYLEELDAAAIAEITGFTPGAIATRISRLKAHLAKAFQEHANV